MIKLEADCARSGLNVSGKAENKGEEGRRGVNDVLSRTQSLPRFVALIPGLPRGLRSKIEERLDRDEIYPNPNGIVRPIHARNSKI